MSEEAPTSKPVGPTLPIRFTCLGTLNQDLGTVLDYIMTLPSPEREFRVLAVEAAGQAAQKLVAAQLPVSTGAVVGLLVDSHTKYANFLKNAAHAGCGQDLGETLEAIPRDGASHEYTCPKCGRVGHATRT